MTFENREQAGEKLAIELRKIIKNRNFVVVSILRGGIVLGKRISDYFNIPLLPLSVKKIGAPLNMELAIGAVTFNKTYYFDRALIKHLQVDKDYMESGLESKWKEAQASQKKFSGEMKKISLKNKKVVVVDDGVATGTTAISASFYIRRERAKEIILATPVIAKDVLRNIKRYFDSIVSLKIAGNLSSVSEFYKDFPQVTDKEVIEILNSK